jgi:membrane dipeptidase
MIIVDTHCDTAGVLVNTKSNLYSNNLHVDLKRQLEAGRFVQFFAAFIDHGKYRGNEMRRAIQIIDRIYCEAEEYPDYIQICNSYSDISKALNNGKVAAVISIEGGEALEGELSALRMFYRMGVRSICLTWNYRNEIADGVGAGSSGGGLTPFGVEVIAEMNRLGMLIDVSHLSEKGFWDVIASSKAPIIASHSNSRAVCDHPRNLTDQQIEALKNNGGVMGLNLYPAFLNNTGNASIDDILRHIEKITEISGEDHIGLGADFDGIDTTPVDLRGVHELHGLFERLLSLNYTESFVEKLAGGNYMRLFERILK